MVLWIEAMNVCLPQSLGVGHEKGRLNITNEVCLVYLI